MKLGVERARRTGTICLVVMIAAGGILSVNAGSAPAAREQVGPLPTGGFLLNTGWVLRPAGVQVPVDTFPMSSAVSPDGKYVLVLNGGYNPPSISVLDPAARRELSRQGVPDGWLGLAFAPKGDRVYVGGGSQAAVFEFTFESGALKPARTFPAVPSNKRTPKDFVGDVALSPNGRFLYAADLFNDSILVINPQSGVVIEKFKTGRRPYRILFHPDGNSFFVSSWADGAVLHHDAEKGTILSRVRVGPQPMDMVWAAAPVPEFGGQTPWARRIFVSAANTNNVYSIGVSATKELQLLEGLNVALTPRQPAGMTPSAVAVSADGRRLYAVCSDANAVAVIDVSGLRGRVLGFIPTGWYPTAARALDNGQLMILNGRGAGSRPNPQGPDPTRQVIKKNTGIETPQYVGSMQGGTVQFIDTIGEEALAEYSLTVLENSPYSDEKLIDAGSGKGNPVPARPGDPTPIQYVVYIVKENRTYDQVLGDMKEGRGDPSLCRFPEQVTPNHHKLAREFVLLDNFYVSGDVDGDGHNWSVAAIAPGFVQRLWQNSYAGRRAAYDYEGGEPAATPPAAYLWTNAIAAQVPVRNYGHFAENIPNSTGPDQVARVRDPALQPFTNMRFRGFDLSYSDVERAKVFLQDLAQFEASGSMPRLILMRLGNDHTSGTTPGAITPSSAMADNDYALGMVVEALSRSRFWPQMAIFVVEDDAQHGADHIDSHRSLAFVISPYVRRRAVDSTMYNTASVLRTIGLILGLRPLTHFDAGARPMPAVFQAKPDTRPYTAEQPRVPLNERNGAVSHTQAQ